MFNFLAKGVCLTRRLVDLGRLRFLSKLFLLFFPLFYEDGVYAPRLLDASPAVVADAAEQQGFS